MEVYCSRRSQAAVRYRQNEKPARQKHQSVDKDYSGLFVLLSHDGRDVNFLKFSIFLEPDFGEERTLCKLGREGSVPHDLIFVYRPY